jgi:hypothetical protein
VVGCSFQSKFEAGRYPKVQCVILHVIKSHSAPQVSVQLRYVSSAVHGNEHARRSIAELIWF